MTQETDHLIELLSSEAAVKVKVVAPRVLLALCALGFVGYVCVVFAAGILHLRPDLTVLWAQDYLFTAEILSLMVLIGSTALATVVAAYPDYGSHKKAVTLFVGGALLLFLGSLVLEWSRRAPAVLPPHADMNCLACIMGLALVPVTALFFMIRRLATVRPGEAGIWAAVCAFGLGALMLRLSEQTDAIDHILSVHYAPMVLVCGVGYVVGKKALKW